MSEEYEEEMNGDENGATGPGAPTPVTALEVSILLARCLHEQNLC